MRLLTLALLGGLALVQAPVRSEGGGPATGPAPAPTTNGPTEGLRPADSAPSPGRPEAGADAGALAVEPEPTPPGSPADQELWRAAGDVSHRVYLRRMAANKLQWDLRQERPDERLAAAAKGAAPEEAARLESLRQRLVAAWGRNYEILVGQWPVDPTRVCLYQRLFLGSSMSANDGPQLAQARDETRRCVEIATAAVARMDASTRDLEAVRAEAAGATPRVPTPAAASVVPPAGPPAAPSKEPKE